MAKDSISVSNDVEIGNLDHATSRRKSSTTVKVSDATTSLDGLSSESTTSDHHVDLAVPEWFRSNTRQHRFVTYIKKSRFRRVIVWLVGPDPPQRCTITPFLPKVQSWSYRKVAHKIPGKAYTTVAVIWLVWVVAFSAILATSNHNAVDDAARLSCISRLWYSAPACGLDGENCQPFENADFTFTCPADCARAKLLNPYTVGSTQVNYRSLVIGGPVDNGTMIYRGDSWICAAAIHAGLIKDHEGGTARLHRLGMQRDFKASTSNGIESIGFASDFPLAYTFSTASVVNNDPQWYVFAASLTATVLIAVLCSRAELFVSAIFPIIFFQASLASDAPYFPKFGSTLSTAFGRFLPAVFVCLVLHRLYLRKTLCGLEASID